jgi:hypothetical protein
MSILSFSKKLEERNGQFSAMLPTRARVHGFALVSSFAAEDKAKPAGFPVVV